MTDGPERGDAVEADLPRAVLDTSVLISQHRHWLWLFARGGYFSGVWSTFIVAELVRVRVRSSIQHGVAAPVYRERINNLVHQLSDVLSVAPYRSITLQDILADPDDEPILAAALASKARMVVSLNVKHFPPTGEALGVRFTTPDAFLGFLTALHPAAALHQQADEMGKQLPYSW